MSQDYDQDARERPLGPAPGDPAPGDPAPGGRRELPVWLQYVGVIIPLIVGIPAALFAIRSTTLDPLFWFLVLVISAVVGFISVQRSGPGRVALVATAVGVAAAVGAAGSFGYQQGRKSSLASPAEDPSSSLFPDDPPTTEARVRHHGELVLPQANTYVDLDARAEDPQWGTLDGTNRPGTDLRSYSGEMYPEVPFLQRGARIRYGEDVTDASFTECRSITGYSTVGVSFRGSEEGDAVCVHTDEGRFSRLKFVSYNSSTGVLTLVVTTWDPV
ncbi:MAG: hypothetical protein ACRDTF_11925 [Pseudonocardiaceae bacterium]